MARVDRSQLGPRFFFIELIKDSFNSPNLFQFITLINRSTPVISTSIYIKNLKKKKKKTTEKRRVSIEAPFFKRSEFDAFKSNEAKWRQI